MSVVDLWVNVMDAAATARFANRPGNAGLNDFFRIDPSRGTSIESLIPLMDELDVGTAVLAGALSDPGLDDLLAAADAYPGRFVVAASADRPASPVAQTKRLREVATHPHLKLVRVSPLWRQVPLNDRLFYPIYTTCAEFSLPVSINVGVPGPQVRSACQHPELLEDVLIDFPELVVIGAHMGHPYEALLISYMMKWPNLYLSNSAYSAKYMDPELVRFMGSSRGFGRVLFASDHPFLPLPRALEAARSLPLGADALDAFLGGTARRLLGLP